MLPCRVSIFIFVVPLQNPEETRHRFRDFWKELALGILENALFKKR